MVNVNNLSGKERLLISLRNSGEILPQGSSPPDYRVNRCCGRRPTRAGGVAVDGPPNRRSKNDGPDEKVLSLAKLTPAGKVSFGRA